mgnify:CR=1 FL=1
MKNRIVKKTFLLQILLLDKHKHEGCKKTIHFKILFLDFIYLYQGIFTLS